MFYLIPITEPIRQQICCVWPGGNTPEEMLFDVTINVVQLNPTLFAPSDNTLEPILLTWPQLSMTNILNPKLCF